MGSIWIYIPPIILVVALTALVIVLGKKFAEARKKGAFLPSQDSPDQTFKKGGERSRLKSCGLKVLKILEKLLLLVKFSFKKAEAVSAGWLAKIRERRSGKRPAESKKTEEALDSEAKPVSDIKRPEQSLDQLVTRKEKPEVLPKAEEKPLIKEDKVKESALIYRIAENPKDIEAYRELGDYCLAVGNIKDAKEAFKMVLKLRPRDLKAKSCLRDIEMKMRLKT